MIQPSDIHTLTDFKRNSGDHIEQLEDTGRPQVLTVEGRPKVVVMGIESFERLAELAARGEDLDTIRKGFQADASPSERVRAGIHLLEVTPPASSEGDESELGAPISDERWERIVGTPRA